MISFEELIFETKEITSHPINELIFSGKKINLKTKKIKKFNITEIYNKYIIFIKLNKNYDIFFKLINIENINIIKSIELYSGKYTKICDIFLNTNIDFPLICLKLNDIYLKITYNFSSNIIRFKTVEIEYVIGYIQFDLHSKFTTKYDNIIKNGIINLEPSLITYEILLKTYLYDVEYGFLYNLKLLNNEYIEHKHYNILFGNDIKLYSNKTNMIFAANSIYQDVKLEFQQLYVNFILEPIKKTNNNEVLCISSYKSGLYDINCIYN